MATLNYTTTITAAKTVTEIQTMLGAAGASAVGVQYRERQPSGVSFTLPGPHGNRSFALPVNASGMHRALLEQWRAGHIRRSYATEDQAERTAWRVLKDWLAAQLALVEAQMATLDQVMLPYLHVDGETTLYEAYRDREQLALEVGNG